MPIKKANKFKKRSLNEGNTHHIVFKRNAIGFIKEIDDYMKIDNKINIQEKGYFLEIF
jgi:hypothetical protein